MSFFVCYKFDLYHVYYFRMAAGGSVYGACDELVDPWCDPCFNDGVSRQATSYCDKCVEFYCQTCFESHRRFRSTKHKVVQGSHMPASQAAKAVKYSLCAEHEVEAKDQYCYDHFILICSVCSVRQHKGCNVKSVQEACKSFNIATDEQTFSRDIVMLLEYVKTVDKSLQENINNLDKETQNALNEAENIRDKKIQQINRSFEEFSRKVGKLHKEQQTILDSCKSAVEQLMVDIQVITQQIQKLPTVTKMDPKLFIELQTYSESILLYEDKIANLHLSRISVNYDFNLATQSLSESPSKLGDVSVRTSDFSCDTQRPVIHYPFRRDGERSQEASGSARTVDTPCPVNLIRLGETNRKISGDSTTCHITGLAITADGHLIVTDLSNRKVKLFSWMNGQLLSFLKLSVDPTDVAVVDTSTAAVSIALPRQIVILHIGRRGQLSERKTVQLDRPVYAIAAYNKTFILACVDSVIMINKKGRILWSTEYLSEKLFDYARYLTVRSGSGPDTVIVADVNKQTITVLEADSGKLVKVYDVKGRYPRGLTVDDNGNIYVCYESGEISVWSGLGSGGVEKRCRTTSGELKFDPWGIFYSTRGQQLIVTRRNSDFLYHYKIAV